MLNFTACLNSKSMFALQHSRMAPPPAVHVGFGELKGGVNLGVYRSSGADPKDAVGGAIVPPGHDYCKSLGLWEASLGPWRPPKGSGRLPDALGAIPNAVGSLP